MQLFYIGGEEGKKNSSIQKKFFSKVEINEDLQALGKFLDARYKFIDPNVKINKAVYCFECEYFNSQ